MKKLSTLLLLFFCFASSGQVSPKQSEEENRLLRGIRLNSEIFAATHGGALPTNWTLMQDATGLRYWSDKEAQFREFGSTAGFSNSIYEKFVFVSPGVNVPIPEGGDILFLSAAPYLEVNGEWVRAAVYLRGTNVIGGGILESLVKKAFATAGQGIPQPPPMPSAIQPDPAEEALKLHEAKFHREHPELFNGSPKQRGLAWEKYAAEGLNPTNPPPPAESGAAPLAFTQPPVPPASGSGSLLWPPLVLAFGARGGYFSAGQSGSGREILPGGGDNLCEPNY